MDEQNTIRTIAELLVNGSGNAALLFLVFIGWRAANAAREVAADIKALRALVEKQADVMRETRTKVDAIEARLQRQEELRALVARGVVA